MSMRGVHDAHGGALDRASVAERLAAAQRVHVTGGPGMGKSTFANRLGAALRLPVFQLDLVAYEGPDFVERPHDVAFTAAREIAESPRWITEGISIEWTEPIFARADMIVWLDHLSWVRAMVRIVKRSARLAAREVQVREGTTQRFLRVHDYKRNLKHFATMAYESREYWSNTAARGRYPTSRHRLGVALAPFSSKVTRVATQSDAKALQELIDNSLSAGFP